MSERTWAALVTLGFVVLSVVVQQGMGALFAG